MCIRNLLVPVSQKCRKKYCVTRSLARCKVRTLGEVHARPVDTGKQGITQDLDRSQNGTGEGVAIEANGMKKSAARTARKKKKKAQLTITTRFGSRSSCARSREIRRRQCTSSPNVGRVAAHARRRGTRVENRCAQGTGTNVLKKYATFLKKSTKHASCAWNENLQRCAAVVHTLRFHLCSRR